MAKIKFFTRNMLREANTVTVSGVTDDGYPKERLFDGYGDLLWKATETGQKVITVYQSDVIPVELLLAVNHNIFTSTVFWQYSDNGEDWTNAISSFVPGSYDQIEKVLSAEENHAFWRIVISTMTDPQIGELFMGSGYEFQCRFDSGKEPIFGGIANVVWTPTVGGSERSTKLGLKKRTRVYSIFLSEPVNSDITKWDTMVDQLSDFSLPFVFRDHEGSYFLARFDSVPDEPFVTELQKTVTIELVEML